ncbi:MAG: hypothetical protein HRT45_17760, partial [Bdellovibrionales bacterium]|nr:hypothetical protein [Bdellovibrionales bacterium]
MRPKILTLTLALTSLCAAASAETFSWQDKLKEQSWKPIQVSPVNAPDVKFDGLLTDQGKVRLEGSVIELSRGMTLSSSDNFAGKGLRRFKRWCQRHKGEVLRRRPTPLMDIKLNLKSLPKISATGWQTRGHNGAQQVFIENLKAEMSVQQKVSLNLASNAGTLQEERYEPRRYNG